MKSFKKTLYIALLFLLICLTGGNYSFSPQATKAYGETLFSDDFTSTTGNGSNGGWTPKSGGWNVSGEKYSHQDVWRNYTTTPKVLYENDFSSAINLSTPTGDTTPNPVLTDGYLKFDGTGTDYTKPKRFVSSGTSWTDYTISMDFEVENTTRYGIVYLRSNESRMGGGDIGYNLLLYNTGSMGFMRYNNNSAVSESKSIGDETVTTARYNGVAPVSPTFTAFTNPIDPTNVTHWRKLIIQTKGTVTTIWVFQYTAGQTRSLGLGDFADDILSTEPNLQFKNLSLASGTVALGHCIHGTNRGDTNFDNLQITSDASPVITPTTLYRDNGGVISPSTTNISIDSSANMNGLVTTIESPTGKEWTNTQSGATIPGTPISLTFPSGDFSGSEAPSLNETGTYLTTSVLGSDIVSHSSFEVKEKPVSSFVVTSDSHIMATDYGVDGANAHKSDYYEVTKLRISSFASDIGNEKYFPAPNNVFILGDIISGDDTGGVGHGAADTAAKLQAVEDGLAGLGAIPYKVLPDGHDLYISNGTFEAIGHIGQIWASVFGNDTFNYNLTDSVSNSFVNSLLSDCSGDGCVNPNPSATFNGQPFLDIWDAVQAGSSKNFFEFVHKSLTNPRLSGEAHDFYYNNYYEADETTKKAALNKFDTYTGAKFRLGFSGHSHVNNIQNVINSEVVSINGMGLESGEYRLIEVYDDRVEVGVYNTNWKYNKINVWGRDDTDVNHTAGAEYTNGLPNERNVVIGEDGTFMNKEDVAFAGNTSWQNYELTGKINLSDKYIAGRGTIDSVVAKQSANEFVQGPNEAGFIVRYIDDNNYVHLTMDTGGTTGYDHINLWQKKNGKFTRLASTRTAVLTKDTPYYVKITASDSDSVSADICTDSNFETCPNTVSSDSVEISTGKIGLASYGDTTFDDIEVVNLTVDPPVPPTPTPSPSPSNPSASDLIFHTVARTYSPAYQFLIYLLNPLDDTSVFLSEASIASFETQLPILKGQAPPYSSISIEVHSDVTTGEVTSDKDGFWEYKLPNPLDFGDHEIRITVRGKDTGSVIYQALYKIIIVEKAKAESNNVQDQANEMADKDYFWWYIAGAALLSGLLIYFLIRKKKWV